MLCGLNSQGQRESGAVYDLFNLQTINPAYVGSWKTIGFTGSSSQQWIGLDEHPASYTFSFQAPLDSIKSGIGITFNYDGIGPSRQITMNPDYSYKIIISNQTSLRVGVRAEFKNYYVGLKDLIGAENDPAIKSNINEFMFSFGSGLFLSSPRYYLSLSMPKIYKNGYYSKEKPVFFAGGMIFKISDFIKFKPTFMLQATPDKYNNELSANFLFAEQLWIGGIFRSKDSFGVTSQWIVCKKFRIGYAYFFHVPRDKYFYNGTHDFMLSYEIPSSKLRTISSRYF
jgi:type IX secretion system PorP/SprF family membrane protein